MGKYMAVFVRVFVSICGRIRSLGKLFGSFG
jgi:hypothetical protein